VVEVLNYAIKHGYRGIADEAAPITIGLPLKSIGVGASPAWLAAWVWNLFYLKSITNLHFRSSIMKNGWTL
jgi:hypothetical protein